MDRRLEQLATTTANHAIQTTFQQRLSQMEDKRFAQTKAGEATTNMGMGRYFVLVIRGFLRDRLGEKERRGRPEEFGERTDMDISRENRTIHFDLGDDFFGRALMLMASLFRVVAPWLSVLHVKCLQETEGRRLLEDLRGILSRDISRRGKRHKLWAAVQTSREERLRR